MTLEAKSPSSDREAQSKSASNKRPRSSPNKYTRKDKVTKLDYWLNPQPSTSSSNNRFNLLSENEDTLEALKEEVPTIPKPPPLFVAGVRDVNPLYEVLNKAAKNNYYIKVLNSDEIKIQTNTPEAYDIIVSELNKRNTEYYSYQKKQDRAFRAVLKNIHSSTNIESLKAEIEEMGHIVLRINNIRKKNSSSPLPMFFVDLKTKENYKDIYNIQYLMNTRVLFESPHKKRDIPQCTKCQRYGHTKNFCNRQPRCVKCTASHSTKECPIKEKSSIVKCVNCNGNHPASYKGCIVYKELQRARFVPLRQNENEAPAARIPRTSNVRQTSNVHQAPNVQSAQGATYADVTRGPPQPGEPIIQAKTNPSTDMEELKFMMKSLIQQVSTMLNLLTTLVNNRNAY